MASAISITCACRQVGLRLSGRHVISVECMCESCRKAGLLFEGMPGPPVLDAKGATHFVLYRKDRVACTRGAEHLKAHRLTANAPTGRVIATCCNSAMFLDFSHGHWLSLYGRRWPAGTAPTIEMRTMASDFPGPGRLPTDVQNLQTHSFKFFAKLISAWAAMGFRSPKVDFVNGPLDG